MRTHQVGGPGNHRYIQVQPSQVAIYSTAQSAISLGVRVVGLKGIRKCEWLRAVRQPGGLIGRPVSRRAGRGRALEGGGLSVRSFEKSSLPPLTTPTCTAVRAYVGDSSPRGPPAGPPRAPRGAPPAGPPRGPRGGPAGAVGVTTG